MHYAVEPGLYRGPYPTTGDAQTDLLAKGVKTIVSLQTSIFEFFHREQNSEERWAVASGIAHEHFELSFLFRPHIADLKAVITILKTRERPIYVHCAQGVDRTGMVVAAYRMMVNGWGYDQAVKEMRAMGFHYGRYFWWVPELKKISAHLPSA